MAKYSVTAPDGHTYSIDGPEGASDEQVRAEVLKQNPGAGQKGAAARFVEAIPRGVVKGVTEGIASLGDIAEGPVMGLTRFVGRQFGWDTKSPIRQAAEAVGAQAQKKTPQPQGAAGGYGETTAEFLANPLSYVGPGGFARKAAGAVAGAVGSETGAQLFKGSALEPYARFAGALVGGIAPEAATSAVRTIRSPTVNVSADLNRALQRDGDTVEGVMQRLQQARQLRPNATIADVAGENVRGLVERVAQTPGAGRTIVHPALTDTQRRQMGRIVDDLSTLTGTEQTARQAIEQTMAERRAAADPAYNQAMNFNARAVPEIVEEWNRVTSTGWGRQVLGSADFRNTLQTEYGIADPAQAPLMQVIDAWKKEVDGLIGEATRSGNNNRARVLGQMRDGMIGVVDQHNPAYAQARAIWAGPTQYIEAIEQGAGILTADAETLRAQWAGMTEAQREAFRIGAVSAIRGKMGRDPADLANMTKYIRSPEMRAKVATIMPTPEASEAWTTALDFEVRGSQMAGQALRGSQTARRLAEQDQADGLTTELAMGLLSHGPGWGIVKNLLLSVPTRVRDTLRSRADNLLAEILVTPEGGARLPQATAPAASSNLGPAALRSALQAESTSPLAGGVP